MTFVSAPRVLAIVAPYREEWTLRGLDLHASRRVAVVWVSRAAAAPGAVDVGRLVGSRRPLLSVEVPMPPAAGSALLPIAVRGHATGAARRRAAPRVRLPGQCSRMVRWSESERHSRVPHASADAFTVAFPPANLPLYG
jgi:hypothetical protein